MLNNIVIFYAFYNRGTLDPPGVPTKLYAAVFLFASSTS